MAEFSAQAEIKVLAVSILIWSSGSSSSSTSVIGRIHPLAAVGLSPVFLLSPGDRSQLEITLRPREAAFKGANTLVWLTQVFLV